MYQQLKRNIFMIIQPAEHGSIASRVFDLAITLLILWSVLAVFVATFQLPEAAVRFLAKAEVVTVVIFTAEYLLRIWTADLLYPELTPLRARFRYMRSSMAVIDLVAILPFYLPYLIPIDLISMRAIRLVRLLRILKLNRYTDALVSIGAIFKEKSRQLIASSLFVGLLLIIASLLIYNAEHEAQPDKFQNAFSGIWWAVATLTTVGYGDIYPITALGKILGAIIAILGIGMVAIPTGILSSGFIEHLSAPPKSEDADIRYCPHCGKKLK